MSGQNNLDLPVAAAATAHPPRCGLPEASVFIAIDTSGSMQGMKIQQVSSSLQEIIAKVPNYVRFVIRKFDTEVITIVSKKKKYLDGNRLARDLDLAVSCGNKTALYDGWGQTIEEIPYSYSSLDKVHVLIFTDGIDNASKKYTLDSVIQLVNARVRGNMHFTFIQAGLSSEVSNMLKANCAKERCTLLHVQNSAQGIRMGFAIARDFIGSQFNIYVSNNAPRTEIEPRFGVQMTHETSYSHSNIRFRIAQGRGSLHQGSARDHWRSFNTSRPPNQNNTTTTTTSSQGRNSQTSETKNSFQETENINAQQSAKSAKQENKEQNPTEIGFRIWVGNIPKTASHVDIMQFFTQWGKCNIETTGKMQYCQCALLCYKVEDAANHALRFGTGCTFMERKLTIQKIR